MDEIVFFKSNDVYSKSGRRVQVSVWKARTLRRTHSRLAYEFIPPKVVAYADELKTLRQMFPWGETDEERERRIFEDLMLSVDERNRALSR